MSASSLLHPSCFRPWFLSSYTLLLLFVFGLPISVKAQEAPADTVRPLSPSVVLVLKLVSKTLLKPTTGIVISDDGLVLVPASLVINPGEIVVLDDGTDVSVNGRPALIVDIPHSGGLALISVPGLGRPGITLSENALEAGQTLHLETFPPPKLMAEGAQPLWVPVEIAPQDSKMRAAISPQTPLPYITGPIIDACGYFAGLSLALGPSSMELDKLPIVAFTDELIQIFDAMQVKLATARCQSTVQSEVTAASIDAEQVADAESGQAQAQVQPEEPAAPEASDEATDQIQEEPQNTDSGREKSGVNEVHSVWSNIPTWLILVGILILIVLLWKSALLVRLTMHPGQRGAGRRSRLSAADEPDTAKLGLDADTEVSKPRSAPLDDNTIPDMTALPLGCDAVVMIEGYFDTGTAFKRYCAVDNKHIDIIIGRGDADISIEHPAISREHARLVSYQGSLTLSDLGSSNGSFIGDIPCLPGEIMFIDSGDEIFLGQLKMNIKIARTQAELT